MKNKKIKFLLNVGFLSILSLPLITQMSFSTNKIYRDASLIENNKFQVNSVWSKEIFGYKTEGANSYRIPGFLKTSDNKLIINADKRIENLNDYNNTIEQVQKVSYDNGETWSSNETIVRVGTPKTNKGLIIDGTTVDATYNNQKKLIFLFNIFAEREGIPNLKSGNPWVYVGDQAYWKVWLRDNGKTFNQDNYVWKELTEKQGWWRLYKIPNKLKHNQINESTKLIATKTYVDNSYNSQTKTITGQVYENVEENELNNFDQLIKRATKHSIYDKNVVGTKYILAKNNHNATLESYDNGKTWTNLQMIDKHIAKDRGIAPFVGNAVGSGIQLKNQKNSKLNGRIIFPMYSVHNSVQKAYYIYSDDGGMTWNTKFVNGLQRNSTEATFTQLEDGSLFWFQRQSIWGRSNKQSVTKSTDGGLTWFNPSNPSSSKIYQVIDIDADGNVFSGLTHFNLKGKDYFLFALPKKNFRYAGSVYITDSNFKEYTEVYTFDKKNKEHFAYSYPLTVNVTNDYAEVLIAYEWSPKTKIFTNDKNFANRPFGGGIQLDKLKISLK